MSIILVKILETCSRAQTLDQIPSVKQIETNELDFRFQEDCFFMFFKGIYTRMHMQPKIIAGSRWSPLKVPLKALSPTGSKKACIEI